MMMNPRFGRIASTMFVLMTTRAATQPTVPVREVKVTARAGSTFSSILQAREIADNALLVNDPLSRQLVKLDKSLGVMDVVLDSLAGQKGSYGSVPTSIISYPGDSTIVVDRAAKALVMLDPQGHVARSLAAPSSSTDFRALFSGPAYATPDGDLVYRVLTDPVRLSPKTGADGQVTSGWQRLDSAVLVRFRFTTRAVDTLARVRQSGAASITMRQSATSASIEAVVPLLEEVDDWTVLPDGTLALVRGHDYSIEFRDPEGRRDPRVKLPYVQKAVTDAGKTRMVDSTTAAWKALQAEAVAKGGNEYALAVVFNAWSAASQSTGGVPTAVEAPPAPAPPGSAARAAARQVSMNVVPPRPNDIPDYFPSVRPGTARSDREGNVWLAPNTSTSSRQGELIYDVVSRAGKLVERVRVPVGRSIIGFGNSGAIYLISREQDGRWHLERAERTKPR